MIFGIGVVVLEAARVKKVFDRFGDHFVERLLLPGERAQLELTRRKERFLAMRFAAKEAAMKALGTGHSRGVFWRGIEVVRHGGPPQLRFYDGAAAHCASLGARGSLLTLTHSRELAIAHVLLYR